VAHWWGVRPLQVWKWRKALGVGATTEGTSRLRSAYCNVPWFEERRQAHGLPALPNAADRVAGFD
jgi:hypothetical protein